MWYLIQHYLNIGMTHCDVSQLQFQRNSLLLGVRQLTFSQVNDIKDDKSDAHLKSKQRNFVFKVKSIKIFDVIFFTIYISLSCSQLMYSSSWKSVCVCVCVSACCVCVCVCVNKSCWWILGREWCLQLSGQ